MYVCLYVHTCICIYQPNVYCCIYVCMCFSTFEILSKRIKSISNRVNKWRQMLRPQMAGGDGCGRNVTYLQTYIHVCSFMCVCVCESVCMRVRELVHAYYSACHLFHGASGWPRPRPVANVAPWAPTREMRAGTKWEREWRRWHRATEIETTNV